ncbi:MAG: hypothetical protein K6G12_08445 [Lachnospiraceae bacterium]|nr:hypothetical protein [Lachnospiraceae bacterium]
MPAGYIITALMVILALLTSVVLGGASHIGKDHRNGPRTAVHSDANENTENSKPSEVTFDLADADGDGKPDYDLSGTGEDSEGFNTSGIYDDDDYANAVLPDDDHDHVEDENDEEDNYDVTANINQPRSGPPEMAG